MDQKPLKYREVMSEINTFGVCTLIKEVFENIADIGDIQALIER